MSEKATARGLAITLAGSGNLAQALGPALKAAGYRVQAVAFRDTAASRKRAKLLARRLRTKATALKNEPSSDFLWLCHTDDALPELARQLAGQSGWRGKIVFHSSGALTSAVLSPLQRAGAYTASLHPMMTFVPGIRQRFQNVPFAVEGDRRAVAVARQIVARLGGRVFTIRKSAKVLYHALGSFSSPLLVATLVTAERVGQGAGLTRDQTRRIIAPILQQTLKNYLEQGAPAAFSGPIKRGDLNTVRRHLRELRRVPAASEVYRALVQSALRDLPSTRARELAKLVG
jgi:predicted short-subunit dehydrogenase-like oxidoreductase (DUF2520 family)